MMVDQENTIHQLTQQHYCNMAEIQAYPQGTPANDTMLVGTQMNVLQSDGTRKNLTRNFTAASIAGLADAPAAYTTYVARWTQSGANGVPISTSVLQNTTGLTWTWTKAGVGIYDFTPNAAMKDNIYVNVSSWEDNAQSTPASTGTKSLSVKTAGPNYIRITNQDNADSSYVDDVQNGMIEIRIY